MTLTELKTALDGTGLPVAYDDFPTEEAPQMPYIVYYESATNNFGADGKTYYKSGRATIELYTINRDLQAEQTVEEAISSIYWEKTIDRDDRERCYIVAYEVTLEGA